MMRRAAGVSVTERTTGSGAGGRVRPQRQRRTGGTMDVLIALLQSIVVLLLASGVYVALVVRKRHD